MALDRWLEFHDSKVVAVHGNSDCICVDLDGYVRQWEGTGSARRGAGWIQRVRIEIDFPDVDQRISAFPVELSSGAVVSEALADDGNGALRIPTSFEGMVALKLVAASGEKLTISGERFRANASGEPRYVEEIPSDMDPGRQSK